MLNISHITYVDLCLNNADMEISCLCNHQRDQKLTVTKCCRLCQDYSNFYISLNIIDIFCLHIFCWSFLEALHIRNIQHKLNRINFETIANVLKCLLVLTLFIETNSKSKCYTIQQYKCSFLQRSNVLTKVTTLL